jgi:hypothetical protein
MPLIGAGAGAMMMTKMMVVVLAAVAVAAASSAVSSRPSASFSVARAGKCSGAVFTSDGEMVGHPLFSGEVAPLSLIRMHCPPTLPLPMRTAGRTTFYDTNALSTHPSFFQCVLRMTSRCVAAEQQASTLINNLLIRGGHVTTQGGGLTLGATASSCRTRLWRRLPRARQREKQMAVSRVPLQ